MDRRDFLIKSAVGSVLSGSQDTPTTNNGNAMAAVYTKTDQGEDVATSAFKLPLRGSINRTVREKLSESISVKDFGALGNGENDDTAAFFLAASTAYAAGGGTIAVPEGRYKVTGTIPLYSWVRFVGDGPKSTEIISTAANFFAQKKGTQCFGGGIIGMTIHADNGNSAATGIMITAAQNCIFSDLIFQGFDSGTIIKIEGAVVTAFDEKIWPKATSNCVFNHFSQITAYGCGHGLSISGHYGITPTKTPANSSPVPDLVVTQNRYEALVFLNVATCGINIKNACDTEIFDTILINLRTPGAIGVDIASDNKYTGNNYVNSLIFQSLVFSRQKTATSGTLIRTGWTFGNRFDIEHDLGTNSGVTFFNGQNSQSHYIISKAIGDLNTSSGIVVETIEKNVYHGLGDGDQNNPSLAFVSDRSLGLFRGSDGELGIAKSGITRMTITNASVNIGGDTVTAPFRAIHAINNRNHIDALGTAAGGGLVKLAASGEDSDLDLSLAPKGSGLIRFGKYTATSDTPVTGYILVKDANGKTRKLAVIE